MSIFLSLMILRIYKVGLLKMMNLKSLRYLVRIV